MGRLSKKVAIITGAAQGIGAAYARTFAAEGADVVVGDVLDTGPIVAELKEKGARVIGVHADVTKRETLDAMVARAVKDFGGVHICVTNAAIFGNLPLTPFMDIESADWDKIMAVNVRGVFETIRAVTPVMRKQKYGKIINVASGTVFKGSPMLLHYVTSKAAVVGLTRAIARELGDDGIRVNCVAPGLVMSPNVRNNPAWVGPIVANNVASRAIKRDAQPEDIVGTVLFLASADSDFMTGQTVVVDGGSVMH
jgi:NAD(P)-dependent dehydrogenase (short-subunit alcohol dehydrogenase family)